MVSVLQECGLQGNTSEAQPESSGRTVTSTRIVTGQTTACSSSKAREWPDRVAVGTGSLRETGLDCLTILKDASDAGLAWVPILALPFTSEGPCTKILAPHTSFLYLQSWECWEYNCPVVITVVTIFCSLKFW